MNHLFQVTIYTGQQLVLEALQRWLRRPCVEPEAQRQRRTSIKSLIVLLLKTAATGVLATILDAAIEYRRRQLIAAAEQNPDEAHGASSSSRLSSLGLGPLTRAGIAAWKSRLVLAIDEMERHAEQYGIEPTHRFTPAKPDPASDTSPSTAATATTQEKAALITAVEAKTDENDEVRQAALSRTIEQLRDLVSLDGEDAERALDEKVDSLLDTILGSSEDDTNTNNHANNNNNDHDVAAANEGDLRHGGFSLPGHSSSGGALPPPSLSLPTGNGIPIVTSAVSMLKASSLTAKLVQSISSGDIFGLASSLSSSSPSSSSSENGNTSENDSISTPTTHTNNKNKNNDGETAVLPLHVDAAAPLSPTAIAANVCSICMDRHTRVQVLGCQHDLCFQCARRLCDTADHSLPQCPFCRQPIHGFSAVAAPVISCSVQTNAAVAVPS